MGKEGENKLKDICARCKIKKWCVDFKEGRHAKITSRSICITCELREQLELGKEEILLLKKAQQEHITIVQELKNEISELKEELKCRSKTETQNYKCDENLNKRVGNMETAMKE